MISRVIEARSDDMRAFVEEAAGISRYKERRRETEARISDTRDVIDPPRPPIEVAPAEFQTHMPRGVVTSGLT